MTRDIDSILVTGGTGSFARAFCRFMLDHEMVSRLCIFSRGEHAQAQMRAELRNDERLRFFIGDVRDEDRLSRAMQGIDLVVHAAALKRIEVGRYNPEEMAKTNVMGAINIVSAARKMRVAKVVALSTDKAFKPQHGSAYGQSKALMETIILAANDTSGAGGPKLAVTRYGNVFGSAGSVVPKWLGLMREGAKEVPVSSMEATRFFMTLDEAVELVVGTAAHMQGGELAIPDLPAYRVGDLVEALGVKPKIIGMPSWEKLHESMDEEKSSDKARRMSVDELRYHINEYVKTHKI